MGNLIKYSSQDMIINHRIYSGYLLLGLDDGWSTHDKQENFKILLEITGLTKTPIRNATILDIGCGTGDFVHILADKDIREYVGIDVFEPAIEKARHKYPKHKFIVGDFLKHNFRKKFDFVFCSGALTTNLETNNYNMLESWIPKMWSLSKQGVAFNFLIDNGLGAGELFFYDSQRVLEICKLQIPQAKIKTTMTNAGLGNVLQEMHVFLY